MPDRDRYDAVILAGGAAERMGRAHKPAVAIGARRLLDIAVDAVADADRVIVVGPPMQTEAPVVWAREDPPGGGPVPALAAGLASCPSPTVVVLAADLPFVTAAAVTALRSRRDGGVASIAVDARGRDQPLLACYDTAALTAAIPRPAHGASMRSLLEELGRAGVVTRVDLGGDPPVTWDCDTEADVDRARELA